MARRPTADRGRRATLPRLNVSTQTPQPALLSVEHAARYIGMSPEWLRVQARRRRIASVKLGNRLLFRRDTLDELIDDNTREPVRV